MQAYRDDPVPLEYILEGTFFCGEWFKLTKNVLIPRYETEVLVNHVVKKSETRISRSWRGSSPAEKLENLRILDLGTGSGNIAIILAKKLKSKIYAVDISETALDMALENSKMHCVSDKIEFIKSDWYNEINIEPVDIIVSNPPYISKEEWDSLPCEVKDYEPSIALYGGEDGLNNYREIISGARKILKPCGMIFLEIGWRQAGSVKELLKDFCNVEIMDDQFGNPRVISARMKNSKY